MVTKIEITFPFDVDMRDPDRIELLQMSERLVQIAKALNCSISDLTSLAEPVANELAGATDAETLSVVRTMQATSPEKRAMIRRVVLALVEG